MRNEDVWNDVNDMQRTVRPQSFYGLPMILYYIVVTLIAFYLLFK